MIWKSFARAFSLHHGDHVMPFQGKREITAETLIRNMQSVLLVFDRDGELSTWNDSAETSLGLAPPDGDTPPEVSPLLKQAVADCIRQRCAMRVEECPIEVDGASRKFGFTANPLIEGDNVLGAVVTGRDITERLKVSEEIDDLRRRAGIEKVARTVAHELRNPLNSIKVHAQYLEMAFGEGDPGIQYAKVISAEVDKMDRLLGGLRDLSRARELDLKLGPPDESIISAWELMRPVAKAKGVEIKLRIEPMPDILHDSLKIQQVFINLLKNAVEAVAAGSHVLLRGGPTPAGGMFAEVLDDGPGITKEIAGRMFDLFFSTKGGAGEGVGLSICQEIIERHRGAISLEEVAGWSTCFRVEIPPP